jgi:glucosamine kinase
MSACVLGVDGGGTKTRVLVADEAAMEMGSAEGDASAVRPGEAARSARVIADAVERAIEQASLGQQRIRCACVGVAGVGRVEEREALTDELDALGIADEVLVVADALVALEDAFGDGSGILLIAGTGSIAFGRGPTGMIGRCGGWGPICGDEGSGVWIGRRALGVVTASQDGREPETSLTTPLLAAAGIESIDSLIPWAAAASPTELARLAPAVFEVAATGDLRANSLVALAVEELGLHVLALARQLFADERAAFPLALSGGLLSKGALMRKRLEHRLKSLAPGAQVRTAEVVAVRGAVKYALRHLGIRNPEPIAS